MNYISLIEELKKRGSVPGLSDIFYTNPYRYATSAEAYAFLKNRIRTEASQDAVF